jgi:hypothetical protein
MCKRDLIHSYYTDSLSKLNYNREKEEREGRRFKGKVWIKLDSKVKLHMNWGLIDIKSKREIHRCLKRKKDGLCCVTVNHKH